MQQQKLDRINELYKKAQQRPLTEAELAEQKRLRKEYLDLIRKNLRSTLDHTTVEFPDKTRKRLEPKTKSD